MTGIGFNAPLTAKSGEKRRKSTVDKALVTRISVSLVVYQSDADVLRRTLACLAAAVRFARRGLAVGESLSIALSLVRNDGHVASAAARTPELSALLDATDAQVFDRLDEQTARGNLGYGAGHNLVIHKADSDYHLILNPDVYLQDDALLVALNYLRAQKQVVLISPAVENNDGGREYLCKAYPSVFVLFLRSFAPGFLRRLFKSHIYAYELRDMVNAGKSSQEVAIASGCCMLVRTAALQWVGGFTERYFLYFEDFDLSLKLGREGRLAYLPDMRIVHHGGYAVRKGVWHISQFCRSAFYFFQEHGWRFR